MSKNRIKPFEPEKLKYRNGIQKTFNEKFVSMKMYAVIIGCLVGVVAAVEVICVAVEYRTNKTRIYRANFAIRDKFCRRLTALEYLRSKTMLDDWDIVANTSPSQKEIHGYGLN